MLTVSNLRPMCELIESDELDALVHHDRLGRFVHFAWDNITQLYRIHEFDGYYSETDSDNWSGWVEMVVYEPENVK